METELFGSAVFVARDAELDRLDALLERALRGQGQVCFVAGEAGAGKTTLVNEFTRRAQERDPDLLVAFGDSNAQTGMADPYLPFREVTLLLTGDVDGTLAEGAITPENAGRLRRFFDAAGETLMESGVDLIDIFIPGGALLTRLGARLAGQTRWGARLEALMQQKAEEPAGPRGRLDQEQIFEQFTTVVRRMAERAPIVLVLDDLHWADTASLGLLFHLSRRIEGSRILVLGTYRPNDLALGRGGERHPLESVLNEIKRYYGDVVLEVGAGGEERGRRFVDALLDAEPNRLDAAFRDALYRHTEGHPLFTVELLRSLRERGVLARDDAGRWAIGSSVAWESLPGRVDGVIAERIGRLEAELRETLAVASVEGHSFTAEVVARVRAADERGIIRRLSGELERQHRLVAAQGVERVAAQRLSQYQFRHSLFQRYLYGTLDQVERSLLHEDVGRVLEELYGERTPEIAVQLARHFHEAGDEEKAAAYLLQAGDTAAAAYANVEARLHYQQALDLLAALPDGDENRRRRIDTTLKLLAASHVADAPERNLERLAAVEPLAAALPDPEGRPGGDARRLARIRYWIGRLHYLTNAPREAIRYYRQVLEAATELGDEELAAIPASVIGRALVVQGHFGRALPLLQQAAAPLERVGNVAEWISTLGYTGVALTAAGRWAEGMEAGERALARARETGAATSLGTCYTFVCAAHLLADDAPRMAEGARAGVEAAERAADRVTLYVSCGHRALAEARLGNHDVAAEYLARCRSVGESLGGRLVIADWLAAAAAEIALRAGRLEEAAELARDAVALAESVGGLFAQGVAHGVWAQALARAEPPDWDEGGRHLRAGLDAFAAGGAPLPAAHLHAAWGRACHEGGRREQAREHLERAAAQFRASGMEEHLAAARALLDGTPAAAGLEAAAPS